MIINSVRDLPQDIAQPDFIIVGAGAVGLTMAIALARKGRLVLLLEAGGHGVDAKSQSYFESARNVGGPLEGLHMGRFRVLGGTTTFWGGQLVRFDPNIFQERPWAYHGSKWPISYDTLAPFYDSVLDVLGLQKVLNEDSKVCERLKINPPTLPDALAFFFTRWMPETNFARLFQKEIQSLPNLFVVLNAPATALTSVDGGASVTGVQVGAIGEACSLPGKTVILANGTIEIARLLKCPLANLQLPQWHDNPWLGRGFMDHVDCVAGDVIPKDKKRFHQLFDNGFLDGVKYAPKIKLSEIGQSDRKLLSVSAHFIFNSSIDEHLANAKIFAKSLLKGRINGSIWDAPKQLYTLFRVGLPMIFRYLRYRRMYNPADQRIQLRLTGEQRLVISSGISLKEEVDSLGMPLIDVNWQIEGDELTTLSQFSKLLKSYLEENELATVSLDERLVNEDPAFIPDIDDANHQMGMARMSDLSTDGVVDRDLKVHGSANLYVAGAAVYPSTGFANPTFTAMALGMRLADKLSNGEA